MSDFLLRDLYALTDLREEPRCARASGWCDGLVCGVTGGVVIGHERWCQFGDLDPEGDEIQDAHHRAMHDGQMAKDLLELGLIQADDSFVAWVELAPGVPRLHRGAEGLTEAGIAGRVLEVTHDDPDAIEHAMSRLAPWMPVEAGW